MTPDYEMNLIGNMLSTVEGPSPAYLIGAITFGIIGSVGWYSYRKTGRHTRKWVAMALTLYPMIVDNTTLLYAIGVCLTLVMFFWQD
jgi:hypothetical protein